MTCGSEGDLGDAVMLLGVMQSIPQGPHVLLFQGSQVTKTGSDPSRLRDLVAPLALKQTYISEARNVNGGEHIDWRSGGFRGTGLWCPRTSLLGAKAYHLQSTKGIGKDINGSGKWLHHITPDPYAKDRIIINRTGRYRNHYFPWTEIVHKYGDRLLFVGVAHEYRDFCGEFGAVEFRRTVNMLEVAQIIAGSLLFIGNQSSPNAVAEGLKHDMIQETSLQIPDCIFKRSNAQHVFDGACFLPGFDGEDGTTIESKFVRKVNVNMRIVPPGLWQYPGYHAQGLPVILARMLMGDRKSGTEEEWEKEVIDYNVGRLPDHFSDQSTHHVFDTFREAHRNAVG